MLGLAAWDAVGLAGTLSGRFRLFCIFRVVISA